MGVYERGREEEGGIAAFAVSGDAASGETDVPILHRQRSPDGWRFHVRGRIDRARAKQFSFKYPKAFSLGQLALHIASVPGSVAAAAVPDTMEAPSFSQPEPKSRQEVLDTFSKGLESAKDTLKKMDDARLMSVWKLTKNGKVLMSVPRIGFIRSILMNHNYHHRGQLSVYLRMLDVPVPSIYGPSADENPFA